MHLADHAVVAYAQLAVAGQAAAQRVQDYVYSRVFGGDIYLLK